MEKVLGDISTGNEDQLEIVSKFYKSFIPMVETANKKMDKVAPKFTGEDCPKCGSQMVHRSSKFGSFEARSDYPNCKYIKNNGEEKAKPKSTGVKCTKCGEGEIVDRVQRQIQTNHRQMVMDQMCRISPHHDATQSLSMRRLSLPGHALVVSSAVLT